MIEYQAVIATRNDLGQLASMQNKFVRLALERLRLSIKEFVDELPAEMDQAYAAAVSTEAANSPRVFDPYPAIAPQGRGVTPYFHHRSGNYRSRIGWNRRSQSAHAPPEHKGMADAACRPCGTQRLRRAAGTFSGRRYCNRVLRNCGK